jgi:hypothetical protein
MYTEGTIIHEDFVKLAGHRVIKTLASRGGVAIGNKAFVMLIGSELNGNTYVGGLKDKSDFARIYEAGLRYYTTVFVYNDTYIFKEDVGLFLIEEAKKLSRGTYAVYIGHGKKGNYMLFVRRTM